MFSNVECQNAQISFFLQTHIIKFLNNTHCEIKKSTFMNCFKKSEILNLNDEAISIFGNRDNEETPKLNDIAADNDEELTGILEEFNLGKDFLKDLDKEGRY